MAIIISYVVCKRGRSWDNIAVDFHREPWIGSRTSGGERDIECQQIIAGFLDDDIFFTIALVAVGGVVDDVEAGPVTEQGEGGFAGRVEVFA